MGMPLIGSISESAKQAVNSATPQPTPAASPVQPQPPQSTYQPNMGGLLGMYQQSPIFQPRRQFYPTYGGFQQPQGFMPYQQQGFMPYQQPMMAPTPVQASTNAGKGSIGYSSPNLQPFPQVQLVPTQSNRTITK